MLPLGDRLMCVWSTAYALDGVLNSNTINLTILKKITAAIWEEIDASPQLSPPKIDFLFRKSSPPDYTTYKNYVDRRLLEISKGLRSDLFVEKIEAVCWKQCALMFRTILCSQHFTEKDCTRIWQIFHCLTVRGSYPPVVSLSALSWALQFMFEKSTADDVLTERLRKSSKCQFSLIDFFHIVEKCSKYSTRTIEQQLAGIFDYAVLRTYKTGRLYKRTRKQSNWSSWQRRWFVFIDGRLEYFDKQGKVKKGEVVVDSGSQIHYLGAFKGIYRKFHNRWKLTNAPYLEIEMATADLQEACTWVTEIGNYIRATNEGLTPVEYRIEQYELNAENNSAVEVKTFVGQNPPKASSDILRPRKKTENNSPGRPNTPVNADVAKIGRTVLKDCFNVTTQKCDNTEGEQKYKIRAIFFTIDKNGNGVIEKDEFVEFLTGSNGFNLTLEPNAIDLIFNIIDQNKNGKISFDEFYDYFVNIFILHAEGFTEAESKLRTAFQMADRNGTGTIDFSEFSDFFWSKSQTVTVKRLMEEFEKIDKDRRGQITYEQFKMFAQRQSSLELILESDLEKSGSNEFINGCIVEDHFRALFDDTEVKEVVEYLYQRWDKYINFKREGNEGHPVMTADEDVIADILPGSYSLLELACFNDIPPIIPRHAVIKGVQWESSVEQQIGRCIFPRTYNGKIPTEVATNQHLAYYGASLAEGSQEKVVLLYRHGVQDFTYSHDYFDEYVRNTKKLGGSCIECHDFAHLDCPLDDDSGFFILGKKAADDEFHFTAFKVPTKHSLYVPSGVIHSNDYLRGKWRTMLSDEVEIDMVSLIRRSAGDDPNNMEQFTFTLEH